MEYVKARESERIETVLFQRYVSDSLFYSAQNQRFTIKLADLQNQVFKPVKRKDPDDIAAGIINGLGLKPRRKE